MRKINVRKFTFIGAENLAAVFKRNIMLCAGVLSVIFISIFSSCSSAKFSSQKTQIQLKGNPTTGYTWVFEIEDESIVSVTGQSKYLGKKGMVGAPSLFTYTVHSLKPGRTMLKFEYKRPWEEKEPEETCIYEVTVAENGKIILNESD